MDPDKFRESRQEINRIYDHINTLIVEKDLEGSKEFYKKVNTKLEKLAPQSEGEIQERSVKNLSIKINALSIAIAKLKPKKAKKRKTPDTPPIVWDEERVSQLSDAFLKKVKANMSEDQEASVCFSTTGKGVRPSYQIGFGNNETTAFSGSGHTPLKRLLAPAGSKDSKISEPFSLENIDSILKK